MKKIFIILTFVVLCTTTKAQYTSPYKLSLAKDITIPTISIGMIGTAFLLERKRPALSINTINSLNRNDISIFDRNATYNWDPTAAKWSDGIMYSSMALPLFFLIDKRTRQDYDKVAMVYGEIFLVNTAITFLTKELVQRKRPYIYNPNAPLSKKMEKDATHSFFSGHVSTVSSMSFGFAQIYSDYYPNSPAKPGIWFAAATLPLFTAILRNKAGKHYWSDVIIGYIVGATVGIVIPRLHKARF